MAVDETWIAETSNLHQGYQDPKNKESYRISVIQPRITIIAAIDNFGNSYLSLLQSNNNQYTWAEFITELCQTLDAEDKSWRTNCILLVDGMKAHSTETVKQVYQKLKIPMIMPPPYSWRLVGTEKWHALFKTGELNPHHMAMSKSKSIYHY